MVVSVLGEMFIFGFNPAIIWPAVAKGKVLTRFFLLPSLLCWLQHL